MSPRREMPFLGSDAVLIPPDGQHDGIETLVVNQLFQSLGLQSGAASQLVAVVRFPRQAATFLATRRFSPHVLTHCRGRRTSNGNFLPVSMWTTGNGTVPRKALRHKAIQTVESLPIDHNTAGLLEAGICLADDVDASVLQFFHSFHSRPPMVVPLPPTSPI